MSDPIATTENMQQPQEDAPAKIETRDEIRARIFGAKAKSYPLTFFGAKIELREPPTGELLEMQQVNDEDKKAGMTMMMCRYVFTPDGQKVFEEADADAIMDLPFGEDMNRLQQEVQRLLGVTPSTADKSPPEA